MKRITGEFIREIFRNDTNDYTVGRVRVNHSDIDQKELGRYTENGEVVIVGYLPQLVSDHLYHFYGRFEANKYGMQFYVDRYEMEIDNDEESLIAFLSSDLFKGIGRVTARRIVDALGNDTLKKIVDDPSCLLTIKGMNKQKADDLYEGVLINYESEATFRFLMNHGFSSRLSKKIFQKYKQHTIAYLKENPYRLMNEIDGIAFKRADQFALAMGFAANHPHRIKASIQYVFSNLCYSEGFTFVYLNQLMTKCQSFLNQNEVSIPNDEIIDNLEQLIEENVIIKEDDRLYLKHLYDAERNVASILHRLMEQPKETRDESLLSETLALIEEEIGITYTMKQKEAIITVLSNPVAILTGGPGTGKTTVVNGIIKMYQKLQELDTNNDDEKKTNTDQKQTIALVAPTGRAAKRLQETTNCEAMTIHRLLGYTRGGHFTHDKNDPIPYDFVICDESSMLDISLASHLLDALMMDAKIVFVGDINQLPSVGPGNVLKDIIESKAIPTVTLEKIHRQQHGSSIIELAHDINEERMTKSLLQKQNDRNFIVASNELILDRLAFIVQNALEKQFSIEQIQILAPMYKGDVGIDAINQHLQAMINPKTNDKKEITHYQKIFRQNDKVIQLVNRPTDYVMNGDIGFITHIFEEPDEDNVRMIVSFDDIEVSYTDSDLDQLSLAYCISIHKSQGSEFDVVIVVLSKSYYVMLRKKLIYTAVTRAKQSLILLGDPKAYQMAIRNTRETKRQTTLDYQLNQLFKANVLVIDNFEFQLQEKPNITPYDFM